MCIESVEKRSFRRTQVCNTDSTQTEELPPVMHRNPGALALHDDVFCEIA